MCIWRLDFRSGDRRMPEEINRLLTDDIADVLWTPSHDADDNLRREGIPSDRIECVGNIMIDSYEMMREMIEADNTQSNNGTTSRQLRRGDIAQTFKC